ncbi:MAG: redoxin domain-containing protein [Acidobacteria bacterium]|nr:redoxin domain-containing protein [Acidobacteriota bacterium]
MRESKRDDVQILAISIDPPELGRKMVANVKEKFNLDLSFPLLSDPGHQVIDRYGLLNPALAERGLPHPAVFLIDKTGVVRWRFVETDYKIRASNEQILEALKSLR